jgi:phospholipid transport system substrate-binding protein
MMSGIFFMTFAKVFRPARRVVLLGLLSLLPAFAAVQTAHAATPAEAFVSENVDKGLAILNNHALSSSARAAQFQTFLEGLTDIDRIGKFTLGAARRTASPQDIAAFDAAFRTYGIQVYQSRLSQYSGQILKVTGSSERQPGDFVVSSVLVDPAAKDNRQPLKIDFRVLNDKGRMVVIDVAVEGIWLAITERDQFSAFLGQHNGSIPALVAHLNQLSGQIRNGGGAPQH